MRIRFILALITSMLCASSSASALDFSILGPSTFTAERGETFTIEIIMTNPSGQPVMGIGASVHNYGANQFVSGHAVSTYLNASCTGPGACSGGLTNLAGPDLAESAIGNNGNRIQFAISAGLGSVFNIGSGTDQGLDQNVGTAMFRVTFEARESAEIDIGTQYQGDGVLNGAGAVWVQAQGATFNLVVIPEPSTAVLIGVGLLGLAAPGPSGTRR